MMHLCIFVIENLCLGVRVAYSFSEDIFLIKSMQEESVIRNIVKVFLQINLFFTDDNV